jgi:hypothetical protein
MATKLEAVYTNPFDKATETADWLDWECDTVHRANEAYRKSNQK